MTLNDVKNYIKLYIASETFRLYFPISLVVRTSFYVVANDFGY